jgi:hypothetical protein
VAIVVVVAAASTVVLVVMESGQWHYSIAGQAKTAIPEV